MIFKGRPDWLKEVPWGFVGEKGWPNPSQEWFHGYNIEHTGMNITVYTYIYIYNMIVGCVQKVHIPPPKKNWF